MAELPFALSGAAAQAPKPTISTSGGNMTQAQMDELLAALMGAGWDGQTLSNNNSGPSFLLGPSMNPINQMANFNNVPYYHASNRQNGQNYQAGMVYPGQTVPGAKPPQPTVSPPGGGSSAPPAPVVVPPVQGTGGGFTGVPGMNGSPGGYGVNLLAPPPMGSGAQWRNTMKYGA